MSRAQDALVRRLRSIEYRINVLEAWDGEMPAARDQYILPAWGTGTGVVTELGSHPVVELIDGASRTAFFGFAPFDRFSTYSDLLLVWVSPAVAGNLLWEIEVEYGAVGEFYNQHNTSLVADVSATAGALRFNESSHPGVLDLSSMALADRVGVKVTRRADLAGDTLGASAYILALLMDYEGNV